MAHGTGSKRSLTAPGFARLLARLHSDAERAGQEYERLRRALVKFFDWRGASSPDDCADEALDRLACKLEDTAVEDVPSYAHGIARIILLEQKRGPVLSSIEDNPDLASVPESQPSDERNCLPDCFDQCLAEMPHDGRSLILRYYEGERHAKISNRRQLAAGLGLSESALRNRVQRLRNRLELCVHQCISVRRQRLS
jgi:DNA-directed RNA polymerase specialized sigma24 family protein